MSADGFVHFGDHLVGLVHGIVHHPTQITCVCLNHVSNLLALILAVLDNLTVSGVLKGVGHLEREWIGQAVLSHIADCVEYTTLGVLAEVLDKVITLLGRLVVVLIQTNQLLGLCCGDVIWVSTTTLIETVNKSIDFTGLGRRNDIDFGDSTVHTHSHRGSGG